MADKEFVVQTWDNPEHKDKPFVPAAHANQKSMKHLQRFVNALLDSSKIDSYGKLEIKTQYEEFMFKTFAKGKNTKRK